MCLLCESVYHSEVFKQLNKLKYLSETLVLCSNQRDLDLTSKFKQNLDKNTQKLIERRRHKKEVYESILNKITQAQTNSRKQQM